MKRRLLSLLLVCVMLCTMLPVSALAEGGEDVPASETAEPIVATAPEAKTEAASEPAITAGPETESVPEAPAGPETVTEAETPIEPDTPDQAPAEPAQDEVLVDEPVAVAAALDEPVPVAESPEPAGKTEFKLVSVGYWENDVSIPGLLNEDYVFAATVNTGFEPDKYTYKLTVGEEDIKLGKEQLVKGYFNDYVWWNLKPQQGGSYTLTVTENDHADNSQNQSVDIYRVSFNPGENGQFEGKGKSEVHVAYGMKDSRWEKYILPSSPKRDSDGDFNGYIGWSKDQNATTYDQTVNTAGAALGGGSGFDVTVYAAYGAQKIKGFAIQNNAGESISSLELGDVQLDSEGVKVKVVNIGNQPFGTVLVGTVPNGFDIQYDSTKPLTKTNDFVELTIKPAKGASLGNYSGSVWIYVKQAQGDGREDMRNLQLSMKIVGGSVTVKPGTLEKFYGETKTANDVTITTEPANYTLKSLGATLTSEGFAANANVGSYDYKLDSGKSSYSLTLDADGAQVIVKATKPQGGDVNATGIHEGQKLSDSVLSGSFTNPYTHEKVNGTLKWKDDENAVLNSTGSHQWVFTPDGNNYESVEGTVEVHVGKATPTVISLTSERVFTYNGKHQGLTFTTDRTGDNTPIVVEYEVDGQWTQTPPKNAGTYNVKATVAATPEYQADDHNDTLTIEKATITPASNVTTHKTYDRTDIATVTVMNLWGKVNGDDVSVSATATYASKDAGNHVITVTYGELTGKDAGNYQLAKSVMRESGSIYTKAITITAKDIGKEYGAELTLTGDMFRAEGLVDGEQLTDQHVDYASAGTLAAAEVGTYEVTAKAHGGNYTTGPRNNATAVEAPAGTMKVIPAFPVVSASGVTASEGKKGGKLSDVTLRGSFVNRNNSAMPVDGTLEWADPDTVLPDEDTFEAKWKFTPNDKNYTGSVTGTVTVTLLDKPTVHVDVQNKTVEYDGEQHSIEPRVAVGDEGKVTLEVEYRLHKDIVTMALNLLDSGHDDFSTVPPVDAGTYDVHVHVNVRPEFANEYADDLIQPTLVITQAVPDISGVTVVGGPVKEGSSIRDVRLQGTKGVDGKPLDGTFSWDHPGTTVSEAGDYQWMFTPNDPNYRAVSGSTRIELAADNRTVVASVYNLPAKLNYADYAVIDLNKSGLQPGEEVTFYADAGCETPVSESAQVPVGVTMTVELDAGALEAAGGTIYARITSSKKNASSVLSYGTEPTLTLLEDGIACDDGELNLPAGGKCQVSVALQGEGYTIQSVTYGLQQTGNTFTVTKNTDAWSGSLESKMGGEAVLTATVTLNHPDPVKAAAGETVVLTVQAKVVCKGVVKDKVQSNPELSGTLTGGSSLQDSVMTPEEIAKAEESGNVVDVVLSVQAVDAPAKPADAGIVKEACGDTYTVGQYMEIDLTKYTYTASGSTSEEEEITETKKPLTIQVSVPATLARTLGTLFDKDFAVVRVHNGVSTILSDLDSDPRTVTFESDQFSTYALVYKDSDNVGSLTVTNKVTGNKGEPEKLFNYVLTVEYPEAEVYGGYVLNGEISGLTFTDGSASFSLKGGESVTVKDLMAGGVFTVAQQAEKDYYTTQTGTTGTVTKDVESKAGFTNERNIYTVTFDANGGKLTGGSKAATGPDGKLGSLPKATKEGEYFAGWYTAKTGGTKVSVNTVYSGDTTLYARWSKTPVTGDENNIVLWGVLLGVSAVALCAGAVILLRKKKKK